MKPNTHQTDNLDAILGITRGLALGFVLWVLLISFLCL